jgi:hypothetical protein
MRVERGVDDGAWFACGLHSAADEPEETLYAAKAL